MEENVLPDFNFTDEEITIENPVKEDFETTDSVEENTPQQEESPQENEEPAYEVPDGEAAGLYSFYRDKGFISNDYEDFDGSYDSLAEILEQENIEKLQKSQEAIVESIIKSNNPVTSKILEYVVTKGNDLDTNDLRRLIEQAEIVNTDLTESSFDDEDVAERYLIQYLSEQGDDEETIDDIIEVYRDKGTLTKKALAAFKKENDGKLSSLNNEIEQAKEEKKLKEENLKSFENNFIQAINNTQWKNNRKQLIYNELAQGNFKNKIENIYNHPKGLVQLLDFMSYFDSESGTFNLDTYKKSSFSDSVKETKENLMNYFRGAGNLSGSDKGFSNKIKTLNDIEFAD